MNSQPAVEPTGSPVAAIVPETVGATAPSPRARRGPAGRAFARTMSVLRGDKYMVGAYPPKER